MALGAMVGILAVVTIRAEAAVPATQRLNAGAPATLSRPAPGVAVTPVVTQPEVPVPPSSGAQGDGYPHSRVASQPIRANENADESTNVQGSWLTASFLIALGSALAALRALWFAAHRRGKASGDEFLALAAASGERYPSLMQPSSRKAAQSTTLNNMLNVTDASFEADVLQSDVPVLIDFWAPWCGPCLMIAPMISEIASEYEGRLKVVKLNTDEAPDTATEYGIRSIPTVMLFKAGRRVETIVGAVPKATLLGYIDPHL
uniref:Thioredoxin domain-containing protein n=1 Tax=Eutreptiella gymnastica TaxID=73025 RepID=A0A7S4G7R3_9EUGL